jgi:uncharacterized protein (UPF0335 family)
MNMSMGKNTLNNEAMLNFVSRVEDRERAKKAIGDEIAVIYAEVKAANLSTAGVRGVVKARKLKPSQFRESEDLRDVYFHAAGLLEEPPLFRSIEALAGDDMSKQAIIDRFAKLVPPSGSIVVEMDGPPVRITRDKQGSVSIAEVIEKPIQTGGGKSSGSKAAPKADVPDVDAAGAEALGRQAFKDDDAIIANPFPFGDARRPIWDKGWRDEGGNDGMGDD